MAISPRALHIFRDNGDGNMGDVSKRESKGRFSLDVDRFALAFVRARFVSGTGTASIKLRLDHPLELTYQAGSESLYDFTLWQWDTMGTTGTATLNDRTPEDELHHWTFERGNVLVFEWTNPQAGTMRWALEVGLLDRSGE